MTPTKQFLPTISDNSFVVKLSPYNAHSGTSVVLPDDPVVGPGIELNAL